MNDFDLSLYLVTDRSLTGGRELEYIVGEAVRGGVTMVQLREKQCSSREFYQLAVRLKKCLSPWRVPLIINDRLDIALACDADGLHLGQSDLSCGIARKILGKDKIIGLSVENIQQVTEANREEVDYIGISPVFSTPTKSDTAPELGLEGVREIAFMTRRPAVAIGGINIRNAQSVIAAGADGISVVSAIMSAPDPRLAASELIQVVNQSKKQNNNRVV